ncbi:MAG: molybdopterin-guanine dinucleotide biosynthesis protein B [Nitrospinae bacterium]|nr:molybdopterin-guanine dinucleotide biosynthesis protein B [Nitrospinota bacterium]
MFYSESFNKNIIPIIGYHNSGKTLFLEKILILFESLKINISVIKHTHHPIEGSVYDKDTSRLMSRGISSVGLLCDHSFKLDKKDSKIDLEEVIPLLKDSDILFLEGFKGISLPKIEIYRRDVSERLIATNDPYVKAIVTDDEIVCDRKIKIFKTKEIKKIFDWIWKNIK